MANIKLTNDNWETSGVYDITQGKTQRQINSELNGALVQKGAVANNTDLNTVTTPGIYFLNSASTYTNAPISPTWGQLIVTRPSENSATIFQTILSARGVFKRYYASGSWSMWRTLVAPETSQGSPNQFLKKDEYNNAVWGDAASAEEISQAVTDWLDANIPTGETVAVDESLTISGAAADSAKAGNAIRGLESSNLAYLATVVGKYINSSGNEASSTSLCHTDYIKIPDYATKIRATTKATNSAGTTTYSIASTITFYDKNKVLLYATTQYDNIDIIEAPIFDNAVYVRVNQPRYEAVYKRYIEFTSTPIVAVVGADQVSSVLTAPRFTNMLLRLANVSKEKTIIVHGGEYDIFDEYTRLGLTGQVPQDYTNTANYMPYNVIVPPNTHIIGEGEVVLKYMPTTSQTYPAESKIISPLNVSGTATVENITVLCKNGRYCIHDETLGKYEFRGAKKKYKNCKLYKYTNDSGYGFTATFGCGFDYQMDFEFDNCEFYHESSISSVFYMHNRAWCLDENGNTVTLTDTASSSRITVKNSIIDGKASTNTAVRFGNVGTTNNQHIRTHFDNCYIRGWIAARDEEDSGGDNPNCFDITLLNCTKAQVLISYQNNQYPVKELNPIGNVAT